MSMAKWVVKAFRVSCQPDVAPLYILPVTFVWLIIVMNLIFPGEGTK